MCCFITLVASTDDVELIAAAARPFERGPSPSHNRSLAHVLKPDERQYWMAQRECDCGTAILEPLEDQRDRDAAAEKQLDRLRRKGWSAAKVKRWLADHKKAEARPRGGYRVDSVEMWRDLVSTILDSGVPRVGLFARQYEGIVEDEAFEARRLDLPRAAGLERIGHMQENELLVIGS